MGFLSRPLRGGGATLVGIQQGVAAEAIMDLAAVARWRVCRSAVLLEEQLAFFHASKAGSPNWVQTGDYSLGLYLLPWKLLSEGGFI